MPYTIDQLKEALQKVGPESGYEDVDYAAQDLGFDVDPTDKASLIQFLEGIEDAVYTVIPFKGRIIPPAFLLGVLAGITMGERKKES